MTLIHRVLPAVVIALAGIVALPRVAAADILSQARLVALVDRTPQLKRSAIDGKPYVAIVPATDGTGYLDASLVDYGYTIDGRDVLIVPLVSGGSGGVFTTLLFTTVNGKPTYAGHIDSEGHLDVHLSLGLINAVTPTYGPNDPQARPSGHKTVRYRLQGATLVKVDEFKS
jgi:hypothetical protein